MTKERPTTDDVISATPRRMFRAGDAAVLLSYGPADGSRDVTVLTDVWTREGGYTDNGCCDVRFRDGRVRRVYSGALVYPAPVCADSAQAALEEQGMTTEKTDEYVLQFLKPTWWGERVWKDFVLGDNLAAVIRLPDESLRVSFDTEWRVIHRVLEITVIDVVLERSEHG